MQRAAVDSFFAYVRRRRVAMVAGGAAAVVAGVIGILLFPNGGGAVWLGALAIFGSLLALGARSGAAAVKEGQRLVAGPSEKMDLTTWPYRTVRSPTNNRLLVTLDVPGSVERTPLAEFKAVWYTPGRADEPTRPADVFGVIDRGRTVVAVADDGSCYLGRVSKVRRG